MQNELTANIRSRKSVLLRAENTKVGRDVTNDDTLSAAPLIPPSTKTPVFAPNAPYQLDSELARGGMGTIYKAYDLRLARNVAIKVLNDRYSKNPEAVDRFVEEAQIAAQLQHPCIPPIHEIGTLSDGRPYLVMKLIQGRTLTDLLAERKVAKENWQRDLAIFEQICLAVAYAHERRVIHRDLKPSNIMVGAFGEVQVMDWGLARVLDASESKKALRDSKELRLDENWVRDPRIDKNNDWTLAGSMIGTPTFMPPEQARGDRDEIGPQSDIFGLGAILCVMLSGEPPYKGRTIEEIRFQAVHGELDECRDRLKKVPIDPEWIDLALDCLQSHPKDRPRDARVVADRVIQIRALIENRARALEMTLTQAEIQARVERSRRKVHTLLAFLTVTAILFAAAITIWKIQQTAALEQEDKLRGAKESGRKIEMRRELDELLRQLPALQTRGMWNEARVLLEREYNSVRSINDSSMEKQILAAQKDFEFLQKLDAIRLDKALWIGNSYAQKEASPRYIQFFKDENWDFTEELDQEALERIKNSPLKSDIINALDDWATDETDKALVARINRTIFEVTCDPFRDPKSWNNGSPEHIKELAKSLLSRKAGPGLFIRLCWMLNQQGLPSLEVLEIGCNLHPNDFWLHLTQGNFYAEAYNNPEKACLAFRAALAIRPDSYPALINLGYCLIATGNHDIAIQVLESTFKIKPDSPRALTNLANAWKAKGDVKKCIELCNRVLETDPNFAHALLILGETLDDEDRTGFAKMEKLLQKDSGFVPAVLNHAAKLGNRGEIDYAIRYFRLILSISPKNDLARANLANLLRAKNSPAAFNEAREQIQESLRLNDASGFANFVLGMLLYENLQQGQEALKYLKKATELEPGSLNFCSYYAACLTSVGEWELALEETLRGRKIDNTDRILQYLEEDLRHRLP